jgi:sugar/nucleoside kinase (ribokinase family)
VERQVLVIGDMLLDVVVTPSGPIRTDGDIPAGIRLLAGGGGGNLAVRLARRGRSVRLVTALGDDAHGAMLRTACDAEGVALEVQPVARSGVVVILVDTQGRRSMLSDRAPSLVPPPITAGVAAIVCSGYALLDATGDELAGSLRERPPDCRLVIVGAAVPPGDGGRELRARIDAVRPELVVCNRDEASGLLGADDPDVERLAQALGERLETLVVVTDPHRGSAASRADVGLEPRAEASGPPLDATGVGDAYAAALVDVLLGAGWPPDSGDLAAAMRAGAELAAQVVGVVGSQTRVALEQAPLAARP